MDFSLFDWRLEEWRQTSTAREELMIKKMLWTMDIYQLRLLVRYTFVFRWKMSRSQRSLSVFPFISFSRLLISVSFLWAISCAHRKWENMRMHALRTFCTRTCFSTPNLFFYILINCWAICAQIYTDVYIMHCINRHAHTHTYTHKYVCVRVHRER